VRRALAAVFVTYNSRDYIEAAVRACLRQDIFTVVVDNASLDGTATAVPVDERVRLVVSDRNLGFAGGVNRAVREVEADCYLLLNPDTELLDGVGPLLAAIGEKGHSAAAGVLTDETGAPQKGFSFRRLPTAATLALEVLGINRIWPGNPVNRRYRCWEADLRKAQVVEQPAGALYLFRRVDWERLGGFDEQFYPVWFEDVDFCRRLLDAGGTTWFTPEVRVLHHGGHSVHTIDVGCRRKAWYGSLLRYAAKHFRPSSRRFVAVTVALAVVPRVLLSREGESGPARVKSIKEIWRLAWKCFQRASSTEERPRGEA
jgi:N-acetylglucosaminyl-diphospho-decaprenol L-rhamnosyltransferase